MLQMMAPAKVASAATTSRTSMAVPELVTAHPGVMLRVDW
jgi:hypothetical protein